MKININRTASSKGGSVSNVASVNSNNNMNYYFDHYETMYKRINDYVDHLVKDSPFWNNN